MSGNYTFTGVDTGCYYVYIDIPNYTDTLINTCLTIANPSSFNNNYCVDSVGVGYCGAAYTTSVNRFTLNNDMISVYPNPNNGSFIIEPRSATKQTMQVYDITGKLVLSQTIIGKTTIDAGTLNEGIYNISLNSNEGVINKRVAIVK